MPRGPPQKHITDAERLEANRMKVKKSRQKKKNEEEMRMNEREVGLEDSEVEVANDEDDNTYIFQDDDSGSNQQDNLPKDRREKMSNQQVNLPTDQHADFLTDPRVTGQQARLPTDG
jgi:hypothetical protein